MIRKVLLVLKDVSLFKSLAQEILARRIPCRISVFQSIPALIESNSCNHADAVLLDASLLKMDALTEVLLRGAMGQKTMVFGRAMNERTAHVLAEAGIQYQAADSRTTLCDALEAMLIEYRSDSHWNAVQLFSKSLPLSTLLRLALRIPVLGKNLYACIAERSTSLASVKRDICYAIGQCWKHLLRRLRQR